MLHVAKVYSFNGSRIWFDLLVTTMLLGFEVLMTAL
jgi:hypothetical protein